MGEVISLTEWSAGRPRRAAGGDGRSAAATGWHPSLGTAPVGWIGPGSAQVESMQRLEGAVDRIDRITNRVVAKGGRLSPDVETELLALLGQISLGLVPEAASRAERLAEVLGGAASSGP